MPDAADEITAAREAARNTFNKTKRVNLRDDRAGLHACPLTGQRRRGALPDASVQRHPQVLGWKIDGEVIAGMVALEREMEGSIEPR